MNVAAEQFKAERDTIQAQYEGLRAAVEREAEDLRESVERWSWSIPAAGVLKDRAERLQALLDQMGNAGG